MLFKQKDRILNKHILFSVFILLMLSVSAFSKIGILVNSDFYPEIREAILTYAKDVELIEKKSVWIDSTSFSNEWLKSEIPEHDLRDTLRNHWKNDSLEGVVLIGDFPIVEIEQRLGRYGPTAIYYMDLNGIWSDRTTDDSGSIKYETYSGDEAGVKAVEIWISMVIPSLVAGIENNLSEKEVVDSYFDRVHKRMRGIENVSKSVYTTSSDFSCGEWKYFKEKSTLAKNYYTSISYDYMPTADAYIKKLQGNYDLACVLVHSKATYSEFGWSGNFTRFGYKDLIKMDPQPNIPFYIHACCHLHDIRRINMGTIYALLGKGLLAFGHGVASNIENEVQPYLLKPLGEGKSFGEAFMHFFNDIPNKAALWRYLSHLTQGVGTLRFQEYPKYSEEVALIDEHNSLSNNKISMNYSNGLLSIFKHQANTNLPVEIKLFTLNGKSVMNLKSQLDNGKLNISLNGNEYGNMSKGLYLCKAFIGNEEKALLINTANR